MPLRRLCLLALVVGISACGGNAVAPTPRPVLSFTFTPNPVPTAGFLVGCGVLVPTKTWAYNLRIDNSTNTPFVILAASFTLTVVGTAPVTLDIDPAGIPAFFGTATIPANGSIQPNLCTSLNGPSGTVSYTFRAVDGRGPFATPSLQLLP